MLCLGHGEGARRGARSSSFGNQRAPPWGEGCAWGLETRPELGGRGKCRGPRLRPASGGAPGPASRRRLTSLPSGRPGPRAGLRAAGAVLRIWNFGFRPPRPPPLPPGCAYGSAPWRAFPAGPAASPPTGRLYLLREPAEGVEAGAASSSAQRGAAEPQLFPAAATALCGAALGCGAAAVTEGRRARDARRGDTAALCPAGEEQPRCSPPREGGWAAEWGGVSGSRD